MDKSPFFCFSFHRCFFRSVWGDSTASYRFFSICFSNRPEKCPILCCFWENWNTFLEENKTETLIFGAQSRFQMLHRISIEEVRVRLVEMWRYTACVRLCSRMHKRRSEFFLSYEGMWVRLALYWQSEARVRGDGWRNQPLTADCFSAQSPSSVPCTVVSCRFTGPHNTPLWTPVHSPCFCSPCSLLLISVNLYSCVYTVNLCRNKQMQAMYTESPEKCAP